MSVYLLIPQMLESFTQKVVRSGYLRTGLMVAYKTQPYRGRHRTVCDETWRHVSQEPANSLRLHLVRQSNGSFTHEQEAVPSDQEKRLSTPGGLADGVLAPAIR
jgi:hypothetical protein